MSEGLGGQDMVEAACLFTVEEARIACRKWQGRLGLMDWDVQVKIVRSSELEGCQGHCKFVIERKQATIRLLEREDYLLAGRQRPQDHEQTLIHELLHLHTVWWGSEHDSDERKLEEQMIHLLAKAFIEMSRSTADEK